MHYMQKYRIFWNYIGNTRIAHFDLLEMQLSPLMLWTENAHFAMSEIKDTQ